LGASVGVLSRLVNRNVAPEYALAERRFGGMTCAAIAARAARSMATMRGRLYWCEAILERLAQHLQDVAAELRELIQNEHPLCASDTSPRCGTGRETRLQPPATAHPVLIAGLSREGLPRHPSWEQASVPPQPVFRRTSSRGADQGKGLINIRAGSSTRGPMPLGQK
jgi:hypothetical protein